MTPGEAGEIVRFLRAHPPFDTLPDDALQRVAASAELEAHAAGDLIFAEGAKPVGHLRVIRSGTIELATGGKVLDVLEEGGVFGHGSLLSGLPTAFSARAVSDSLCYRIEAGEARSLLSGPEGMRFVARSLLEEPTELHALAREPIANTADEPVGSFVRGEPAVCGPETTIREAAQMMGAEPGTAVVVDLGEAGWGILTDRDVRMKVVAGGLSGDEPVTAAMSAPAYTTTTHRRAGDVLAEM
ncbi:MAG: cyclic nucleotide-binding domain-containing protein, partial [Solirubrobacteraceae bacterium]